MNVIKFQSAAILKYSEHSPDLWYPKQLTYMKYSCTLRVVLVQINARHLKCGILYLVTITDKKAAKKGPYQYFFDLCIIFQVIQQFQSLMFSDDK